jgi:hypothetical protein
VAPKSKGPRAKAELQQENPEEMPAVEPPPRLRRGWDCKGPRAKAELQQEKPEPQEGSPKATDTKKETTCPELFKENASPDHDALEEFDLFKMNSTNTGMVEAPAVCSTKSTSSLGVGISQSQKSQKMRKPLKSKASGSRTHQKEPV